MRAVKVRFGGRSDLAMCRKFDYKHVTKDFLLHRIEEKSIILAVAEKPVGYLRIEYLWLKVPYISLIIVEKSQRGKGIGNSMLKFLEKHLSKKGCRVLYSSSQANEDAPQKWHRALGFKECGRIKGINRGIDEIFFRKSI